MSHSSVVIHTAADSWDPPNIPLRTRTVITETTHVRCAPPRFTPTSLDISQYGSPPRSPTSNSNLPHMLLALPSYTRVLWRRLTPSIQNVTHMLKRFLMSATSASRFRRSCVPQGPSEPRWRRNETVYARVYCISSRKACHIRSNNPSQLTSCFIVEVCNDYSLWPHSGLASTSLAGASYPSARCAVYLPLNPASFE
jgi:hypothetical protein